MLIEDLPKDRHYKYFKAAHYAAFSFSGAGRNDFRLGASLVRKNRILVSRPNSAKTHPLLLRFSEFPFLHSESNAILAWGMDNCSATTLYVVRILRNNNLAMAKPCCSCMKLIEYVGISKIFFTTEYGYEEL